MQQSFHLIPSHPISSHLISSHLISSHLIPSHPIPQPRGLFGGEIRLPPTSQLLHPVLNCRRPTRSPGAF
ncbi:unnamed protein product [Chondrus crispus]|uniref:Uncharacterized protein n=1 Tax=Chondrus crispus TaxID=2769 RepID=R7QBC6_CHOCR|nr:unnamed protein product [Chondrus crispus]CDF34770.1 unnamed protein product [Chondrus crispus]|eukprot:XP_005714589.1 unnamed protein product [Chondrus crispus]